MSQRAVIHDDGRFQSIGLDVCVAIEDDTFDEIRKLRETHYEHRFPELDLRNDVLDEQSITLYVRNEQRRITSTVRLSVEGKHELLEDQYLSELRGRGLRIMELGRFVIEDGDYSLLRAYYRSIYCLARRLGFDVIVMSMQGHHVSIHKRWMNVTTLCEATGVTYGGPFDLVCVAWELNKTLPAFFKFINQ